MKVIDFDHLVLTVGNIQRTVRFYEMILGMEPVVSEEGHVALFFGNNKINLHQAGKEIDPKAGYPSPGSPDLCLIVDTSVDDTVRFLEDKQVPIIHGPILRNGAVGPIQSVYIRDPDLNLIEISSPA